MDIQERARLYARTLEPAISGSFGHSATFRAANALVVGFELPESIALDILSTEFNPRCVPPWSEADLAHKVKSAAARGKPPKGLQRGWLRGAESASSRQSEGRETFARGTALSPEDKGQSSSPEAMAFEPAMLRRVFRPEFGSAEWFSRVSPVRVAGMGPAEFLGRVYGPEERILIFSRKRSQGQQMFWRGKVHSLEELPQGAREGDPVGLAGTGAIPAGAPEGIWFLVQPVNGLWRTNEDGKLSRRSGPNLVSCPFLVIESDPPETEDAEEMRSLWLSFLAQLPLPIVAVYESGGKSIHALVRLGCRTAEGFNAFKALLLPILTRFGADPKAIRPVQLSRLPGCYRGERLQRLLYLNPSADPRGIPIANR